MAPTISIDSSGIWGSPTSTLDWCEKNYQVNILPKYVSVLEKKIDNIWLYSNKYSLTLLQITIYIAEFWNTITNLSMIVPALYGLSNVLRQGLERRYLTNLEHNSNQLMLFKSECDSFN